MVNILCQKIPTDRGYIFLKCLPWSWFIACDMQMYIVGLVFAMLISKHPKVGTIGLVASIIAVLTMDLLIGYDHGPLGMRQHHDNW